MTELVIVPAAIALVLVGWLLWERMNWLRAHERAELRDRQELIGALRESQRSQVDLATEIMERLGYPSHDSDSPSAPIVSEDDEIAAARHEAVERVEAELAMMAEKMAE